MAPVMTLGGLTATGDVITGPGYPKFLVKGLPAACVGDMVTGAVCTGAITVPLSKMLIGGRPAATMGSVVNGVNPITGIPMATACAVTPNMNDIF